MSQEERATNEQMKTLTKALDVALEEGIDAVRERYPRYVLLTLSMLMAQESVAEGLSRKQFKRMVDHHFEGMSGARRRASN